MPETMTKTRTMPGIGASATTATLAFALILLAAGAASAQVSRSAGPTLADVKWTLASDDGSATRHRYRLRRRRTRTTCEYRSIHCSSGRRSSVPTQACRRFRTFRAGLICLADPVPRLRRIDGAALAGFSLEKAWWRVDAQGIWGALTTDRETPLLKVDLDVIYGHVSGGVKLYKDLYATARRSTTRAHVRHHPGRTTRLSDESPASGTRLSVSAGMPSLDPGGNCI